MLGSGLGNERRDVPGNDTDFKLDTDRVKTSEGAPRSEFIKAEMGEEPRSPNAQTLKQMTAEAFWTLIHTLNAGSFGVGLGQAALGAYNRNPEQFQFGTALIAGSAMAEWTLWVGTILEKLDKRDQRRKQQATSAG